MRNFESSWNLEWLAAKIKRTIFPSRRAKSIAMQESYFVKGCTQKLRHGKTAILTMLPDFPANEGYSGGD